MRDILTRIDRQREESQTFIAEREKLIAEREKFAAEANKVNRDDRFAPFLLLVAALGSVAAAVAATITLMRFAGTP